MIVCRPRKEWPPYFTLSINEVPGMQGANGQGQRNVTLPNSVTSWITEKFLFDDRDGSDDDGKSTGSIGEDEAVMFVNPTNYTLEVDDVERVPAGAGGERSAFDPDNIEEENGLLADKGSNSTRSQLKADVQSGSHELDQAHIKQELMIGFRDKK